MFPDALDADPPAHAASFLCMAPRISKQLRHLFGWAHKNEDNCKILHSCTGYGLHRHVTSKQLASGLVAQPFAGLRMPFPAPPQLQGLERFTPRFPTSCMCSFLMLWW